MPSLSPAARAEIAYDSDRTGGCASLATDNTMDGAPLYHGVPPYSLNSIPFVVITGSINDPTSPTPPSPLFVQAHEAWLHLQETLLQLSTESRWVRAQHSSQYLHLTEPNLVIEAIRSLLPPTAS